MKNDYSPQIVTCEVMSGVLCSVTGSPVKTLTNWRSPVEGSWEAETYGIQGGPGAVGFVQPREVKAEGGSNSCLQLHKKRSYRRRWLFLEMQREKLKGTSHKLYQGKCWLDIEINVWPQKWSKKVNFCKEGWLWNFHPWRYDWGHGLSTLV